MEWWDRTATEIKSFFRSASNLEVFQVAKRFMFGVKGYPYDVGIGLSVLIFSTGAFGEPAKAGSRILAGDERALLGRALGNVNALQIAVETYLEYLSATGRWGRPVASVGGRAVGSWITGGRFSKGIAAMVKRSPSLPIKLPVGVSLLGLASFGAGARVVDEIGNHFPSLLHALLTGEVDRGFRQGYDRWLACRVPLTRPTRSPSDPDVVIFRNMVEGAAGVCNAVK